MPFSPVQTQTPVPHFEVGNRGHTLRQVWQVRIAQKSAIHKLEFTSRHFAIRLIYMVKSKSGYVVNAWRWRNYATYSFLTCSFV